MSADELLRRWLAQQQELGDDALVLPTASARDVEAVLRGEGKPARPATPPGRRASGREPSRPAPVPNVSPTTEPGPAADGTDWRATLHAAGAGPARGTAGRTAASAPDDAPVRRPPADAPLAPAPDTSAAGSIADVESLIAECRACALFRTALHPVPGEGNPDAELVCVGEAPGATEDQMGRPFVGQAGQLLTKILAAINLRREDVFIVNVLKHRPPGNRNPDPAEVKACQPFLHRQLELISPKVIVALGTFAAQTLLETKAPIGKLRGQVHEYRGIPVVVTYHPAALLRNPAWKRPTWDDVQLARRILDGATA